MEKTPEVKGQIARRAMELGGFPVVPREDYPIEESAPVTQEAWDHLPKPPLNLARVRLMKTIRRIDPLVADLIESLAPVYLVKR
jgi:hypothetical protein